MTLKKSQSSGPEADTLILGLGLRSEVCFENGRSAIPIPCLSSRKVPLRRPSSRYGKITTVGCARLAQPVSPKVGTTRDRLNEAGLKKSSIERPRRADWRLKLRTRLQHASGCG